MNGVRFVIIGGSDAGISAALRARELDASAQITVVLADEFPNYSICGLPFYVSGETPDWHQLAHRTDFESIDLIRNHSARVVEPSGRTISISDKANHVRSIAFDVLLIATGARPVVPKIPGIDSLGVFFLHTMEDAFRVHAHLQEKRPRSAAIIGSGCIGLEMADALSRLGLQVTLIGRSKSVLPTVDASFGHAIEDTLSGNGVRVQSDCEVNSIVQQGSLLRVRGSGKVDISVEVLLVAVGVEPNATLGQEAGLKTGIRGALCVNRRMETGFSGIYAAGDCVETWHRLLDTYAYLPLGTTSHKQGHVAGENAMGGRREFQGSVGTQVVKVFDLAIARTGLRDGEARDAGFEPLTIESRHYDHKAYYPGARQLSISVTGDRRTGKLLGAQICGHWRGEVAKRIDVYSSALFHSMDVDGLNDLDLSYTPPFGSPWDPVQMAAQAWLSATR